ncbi:MAG: hypothetical protein PHE83_09410 [Opitutaceae bacterium]|nr:hypothetical protein [Opitutaceae bacterium]
MAGPTAAAAAVPLLAANPLTSLAGAALGAVSGFIPQSQPSAAYSGTGTYAPGGISLGSKVVGSGSAATSVPSPAVPETMSLVPAAGSAVAGGPAWLQSPWTWIAAAAAGFLLIVALLPPRRRKQ